MKNLIILASLALFLGSCSSKNIGMMNANTELQLRKFDLDITEQRTASLTVTRILGIDFSRLFNVEGAGFDKNGSALIPIVGLPGMTGPSVEERYVLRKLIDDNSGTSYDMIMYPKFEMHKKNMIFISTTDVKVTARFATLKSE